MYTIPIPYEFLVDLLKGFVEQQTSQGHSEEEVKEKLRELARKSEIEEDNTQLLVCWAFGLPDPEESYDEL